ncbi:MAG TPA: RidA family protein [Polyangiales bacterium]|nr:RidA family protein [Polyangiales bacterium]
MRGDASERSTPARVQRLSPDTLAKNPAFAQLVVVDGPMRTLYVGGQNATEPSGQIIAGDLAAQTTQVLKNIEAALAAGGAEPEDIVKWNIFVVQGQAVEQAFGAYQAWGAGVRPAAVTVAYVAGLGRPDALIEVDVTAVVPLRRSRH